MPAFANCRFPQKLESSEMPLDIFQQTFSLAMMASLVVAKPGTLKELQKDYYEKLITALKGLEEGQWSLAWGPTIWKLKPDEVTYAGNAGYIAYNPNAKFEDGSVHPTYIIAISGTPMNSKDVIEKEDNAVDFVVDFKSWVDGLDKGTGIFKEPITVSAEVARKPPSKAYFSKGMAWGTHNLMNVELSDDKYHVPSQEKTMIKYLLSLKPSQDIRFIVAGHSLGGTLTTTISLTLVEAQILPSASTFTYPVAACSAGNIVWAKQWAEKFQEKSEGVKSYQGWNRNLVNNLDCIPQLWCQVEAVSPKQWLGRIPSIYGIPIVSDVWAKFAVNYPTIASKSGVVYKPVPSQYFDGPLPISVPVNIDEFDEEMMDQHTKSYMNEVGITPHKSHSTSNAANGGAEV